MNSSENAFEDIVRPSCGYSLSPASPQLRTGDEVTLEVVLRGEISPHYDYMRIESAPLQTEHVVGRKLA